MCTESGAGSLLCTVVNTYVALFRGINILGRNKLPMAELRIVLEATGCTGVQTYIQSGNAIFRKADVDTNQLCKELTAAVHKSHGFAPRVVVRTLAEIERAAAANPFSEADTHPQSVHLFFLADRAKTPDLKGIEAIRARSEQFLLKGKVFYLYTPDGFGPSKLAGRAEKLLGVDATARNWRTVKTLIAMGKAFPAYALSSPRERLPRRRDRRLS